MRRRGKVARGGGRNVARSGRIHDGLFLMTILDSSRHYGRGRDIYRRY
jgi:hypothetical protein